MRIERRSDAGRGKRGYGRGETYIFIQPRKRAVGDNVSEEVLNSVIKRYKEVYKNNLTNFSKPYANINEVLTELKEKGYNPEAQISGYLITGDPTYITNHKRARSMIRKIDREEVIAELLIAYLEKK